jgi:Fe-S-cluster containining protein
MDRMWRELTDEVRTLEGSLDAEIAVEAGSYTAAGGRIHCVKGCSGCCTLVVNCSFTEALRVAAALPPEAGPALRGFAERLAEIAEEARDLKGYLGLYRQRMGGCPFLDGEGSCSVYTERPISCRALLSTREPHWCSADFSKLSAEEKRTFVESLDRSAVSFPLHYLRSPQNLGRELETQAAERLLATCGVSLYGSLPYLVHLELEVGLSAILRQGGLLAVNYLEQQGLLLPFAVSVELLG